MSEQLPRYALAVRVQISFEEADERVRHALKQEGFGVLTEIDVAKTLREKLDVDFPRYKILGACAPAFAHQALQLEPDIGLLLPCNVVIRDDRGTTIVEALDPVVQLGVADNARIEPIAQEVRARMARVIGRMSELQPPTT